jgi:hypothetical protein
VLRRIFGPEREEVAGCSRRLHNEDLRNLCTSPNIIMMVISRSMRRMERVERMGKMRNEQHVQVGKT